MKEVTVIGHKNPDTDSAVSAFVWSRALSKTGKEARFAMAGKPNRETELVFKKAGVEIPEPETPKGEVFLVDHNEAGQMAGSPDQVIGVIDHHKLGLSTDGPIYFRNEPLGSTSSVIKKITEEMSVELEEEEEILLLCGIISDTLKFNSPTTTEKDIEYARRMAERVNLDIDSLAEEMFKAKSDFSGMNLKEIIEADYKDFEMGDFSVGVGVAEVAVVDFFENKDEEIINNLKKIKKEKSIDYLFFGVIDIIKKTTHLYSASDKEVELAVEAFEAEGDNPEALEGLASRKKQIIPPLSKVLENKK